MKRDIYHLEGINICNFDILNMLFDYETCYVSICVYISIFVISNQNINGNRKMNMIE